MRNVTILSLCQALMMSSSSLIISTSALVGAALAQDIRWATAPLASMFLGTLLCTFPASILMKHIGRRAGFMIGVGVGWVGAGFATLAIATGNFAGFCLGSLLIGVFNGFGQYYRFAAADVATEAFRSRAISYVMAGGVVAAFLGPNLARFSRGWFEGSEFAGSYASILILLMLSFMLLSFTRIRKAAPAERRESGRPLSIIATQPFFVIAVSGSMIAYGVMNILMTATPLAMTGHGFVFSDAAFVIQWHVFAMFAPSFFTGTVIAKVGAIRVMRWGSLLLLACIGVNLAGTTIVHFWLALVLLGLGWNGLFIGGTSLLTTTYQPAEKAKAQGLNDLLVFSTVGLTALSSGLLHHAVGWQTLNLIAIPFVLIAFAATLRR